MYAFISLVAVLGLVLIAYLGTFLPGGQQVLGVVIPYAALATFILGIVYRIYQWAAVPVPFNISTTCGQHKSHPWLPRNPLENPSNALETVGRMALEVLLFRSLFRNTKVELRDGPRLVYGGEKYLWAAALLFHWSFLGIIVRHSRFFIEPIPFFIPWINKLDGLFEIAVPTLYMTDVAILAGLTYLFLRRVVIPQVRYISLPADYFPLFLILGIAISGVLMRHFYKVDLLSVKELATGLFSLHPVVPGGIGKIFYVHLFLVSTLLAYFPFSKLVHMPGIFFSPTRNLPSNSRAVRHINPWNPQVKVHTYEEWEDEFRELMKEAGLPVEKE